MTTSQKLDIKKQLEPLLLAAGFKQDPYGNWKMKKGPNLQNVKLYRIKFGANRIRREAAYEDKDGWFLLTSYTYQHYLHLVAVLRHTAGAMKEIRNQSVEAMNRGPVANCGYRIPNWRPGTIITKEDLRLTDVEFGFRCAEKGMNLDATLEEFRRMTK